MPPCCRLPRSHLAPCSAKTADQPFVTALAVNAVGDIARSDALDQEQPFSNIRRDIAQPAGAHSQGSPAATRCTARANPRGVQGSCG